MNFQQDVRCSRKSGAVMLTVMVLFGMMMLLTIAAFVVSSTDVRMAGMYKQSQEAFFDAEAGLQVAKNVIDQALEDGSLVLDSATETVNIPAPSDFHFKTITTLTRLANSNAYYLTVTGTAANAETVLEAAFERVNLLADIGIFGDDDVQIQPHAGIYSYRSANNPNPSSSSDSTGEVGVGSNESIGLKTSTELDGSVLLGQDDSGADASYSSVPSGVPIVSMGYQVDTDPLGALGGEVENAALFFSNASNNNNADAVPPIVGNEIDGSIYLPPGNFYVEDVRIGTHDVLDIGGTPDNPVTIYFEGANSSDEFRIQPNSDMVFSAGDAVPTAFRLFMVTDNDIRIQPNLDFCGMIYAPYADDVRLQPGDGFRGIIWANSIRIQPGGDIWIDVSLLDQFQANSIRYTQWKEMRNR